MPTRLSLHSFSATSVAALAITVLFSSIVLSAPDGSATVRKLTLPRTAKESGRQRGVDICATPDGRLMVVWAEGEPGAQRVYLSQSDDGGNSFSTPVPVNQTSDALIHGRERTAIVRSDPKGNVYVLWSRKATANVEFLLSRSIDKGKSFSTPERVHPSTPAAPRDLADMDVSHEGVILVTWLQTRGLPRGNEPAPVDLYAARSGDGGLSFEAPVRLDETVCECCSPAVSCGVGAFFVAWRDRSENLRDISYSVSTDSGRSFARAQGVGQDGWRLDMCPMSGPALASLSDGAFVSWMEAAHGTPTVHLSLLKPDKAPRVLAIPGKGRNHPAVAVGPSGQIAVASETDSGGIDVTLLAKSGRESSETLSVSASGSCPKIVFLNDRAIAVAWQGIGSDRIGLALVNPGQGAKQAKTPEVWMSVLPADGLLVKDAKWDYVKKHVDGLKIWTWHIIQEDGYMASDWPFRSNKTARQSLRELVAMLNENHIPLIVEEGVLPPAKPDPLMEKMGGKAGPYDETFSQRAVDSTLGHLKVLESLGGRAKFIDLDVQSGKALPPEKSPVEMCKYMLGVQKAHPGIEFFELTNFPNWGYKGSKASCQGATVSWGDYAAVFERLVREAKKTKAPLRGVTVDNPYDYATGAGKPQDASFDPNTIDWVGRILDLERTARREGLEFNLIVNSDAAGRRSMEDYCKDTLSLIDLYRSRGGRPDRYIVQSWYAHPTYDELVPETKPYTFTWLVKEVIKRVK